MIGGIFVNQLTFVDKIKVLFELLFSSPIITLIFVFSLGLMILLFFYFKINKKIIKFVFIGIYVALIGFAVFKYGSYFLSSLDSFVTIFMANIYFPTIPVYVFIMLISFIIMIVTLSSRKIHRVVKIINTVFFSIIQMLFGLFIYIIETNNIDVSNNQSLYSNEQTLTLLELGMGLFVVWIIVLLIVLYLRKADKIFKTKDVEEKDDFDQYINDYNEPGVVSNGLDVSSLPNMSTSFNNSIVENLVPEVSMFSNDDEEILEIEEINTDNIDPNVSLSKVDTYIDSSNIFNSFDFLDVPVNTMERKNDNDVDVIEF